MRKDDGSLSLFGWAFGGSAAGVLAIIVAAAIGYLLNTATAGAADGPVRIPPFMCKTASQMKALAAERNRFQPRTDEEYRKAWFQAINTVNDPFDPPRCFIAEGDGHMGGVVGQVVVGTTAFDLREADFSGLTFNGKHVRGWFRFYVLVPRSQFSL